MYNYWTTRWAGASSDLSTYPCLMCGHVPRIRFEGMTTLELRTLITFLTHVFHHVCCQCCGLINCAHHRNLIQLNGRCPHATGFEARTAALQNWLTSRGLKVLISRATRHGQHPLESDLSKRRYSLLKHGQIEDFGVWRTGLHGGRRLVQCLKGLIVATKCVAETGVTSSAIS